VDNREGGGSESEKEEGGKGGREGLRKESSAGVIRQERGHIRSDKLNATTGEEREGRRYRSQTIQGNYLQDKRIREKKKRPGIFMKTCFEGNLNEEKGGEEENNLARKRLEKYIVSLQE